MKKYLITLFCSLCALVIVGCSGSSDEGATNINQDVQTGTPPAALDGAAPASPEGAQSTSGGGGPATPSSTP